MKPTIYSGPKKFIVTTLILIMIFTPIAYATQDNPVETDTIQTTNTITGNFNRVTPISNSMVKVKSEKISLYQYWVSDPIDCPTIHDDYGGFSCDTEDICGDLNGPAPDGASCYDTSLINYPSADATTETSDYPGYTGGYLLNCFATTDGVPPLCDNNGNWWCDRSPTCFNDNRVTQCNAGGTTTNCLGCRSGYNDCDTNTNICEIQNGASCGAGTGTYSGCLVTGPGGTGNCVSSSRLDCNNDDSDGVQSTCNGPDGCEVVNEGACTTSQGIPGTIVGCIGGIGNCVPVKSYFETGTEAMYATPDPLLWGKQYGSGWLINFTNTAGDIFGVNNQGCIVFNDSTTQCTTGGGGGGADSDWVISGNDIYRLIGNIGIGTATPLAKLDIVGDLLVSGQPVCLGNGTNCPSGTVDTNAATECSDGYLLGGGTTGCVPIPTDTNASTACNIGQYLDGDGNCYNMPLDVTVECSPGQALDGSGSCVTIPTDTNASTACNASQYLDGDGTCHNMPLDVTVECSPGQALDGSGSCVTIPTDIWVNESGDTMYGDLFVLTNVGIGTQNPLANLDVNGTILVSGQNVCLENGTGCPAGATLTFRGLTTNIADGGMGGYDVTRTFCQLEYPGSHMCTQDEILMLMVINGQSFGTGNAWIQKGAPGFTADANDCAGWTSNSNLNLGAYWRFDDGYGVMINCGTVLSLACCGGAP